MILKKIKTINNNYKKINNRKVKIKKVKALQRPLHKKQIIFMNKFPFFQKIKKKKQAINNHKTSSLCNNRLKFNQFWKIINNYNN